VFDVFIRNRKLKIASGKVIERIYFDADDHMIFLLHSHAGYCAIFLAKTVIQITKPVISCKLAIIGGNPRQHNHCMCRWPLARHFGVPGGGQPLKFSAIRRGGFQPVSRFSAPFRPGAARFKQNKSLPRPSCPVRRSGHALANEPCRCPDKWGVKWELSVTRAPGVPSSLPAAWPGSGRRRNLPPER